MDYRMIGDLVGGLNAGLDTYNKLQDRKAKQKYLKAQEDRQASQDEATAKFNTMKMNKMELELGAINKKQTLSTVDGVWRGYNASGGDKFHLNSALKANKDVKDYFGGVTHFEDPSEDDYVALASEGKNVDYMKQQKKGRYLKGYYVDPETGETASRVFDLEALQQKQGFARREKEYYNKLYGKSKAGKPTDMDSWKMLEDKVANGQPLTVGEQKQREYYSKVKFGINKEGKTNPEVMKIKQGLQNGYILQHFKNNDIHKPPKGWTVDKYQIAVRTAMGGLKDKEKNQLYTNDYIKVRRSMKQVEDKTVTSADDLRAIEIAERNVGIKIPNTLNADVTEKVEFAGKADSLFNQLQELPDEAFADAGVFKKKAEELLSVYDTKSWNALPLEVRKQKLLSVTKNTKLSLFMSEYIHMVSGADAPEKEYERMYKMLSGGEYANRDILMAAVKEFRDGTARDAWSKVGTIKDNYRLDASRFSNKLLALNPKDNTPLKPQEGKAGVVEAIRGAVSGEKHSQDRVNAAGEAIVDASEGAVETVGDTIVQTKRIADEKLTEASDVIKGTADSIRASAKVAVDTIRGKVNEGLYEASKQIKGASDSVVATFNRAVDEGGQVMLRGGVSFKDTLEQAGTVLMDETGKVVTGKVEALKVYTDNVVNKTMEQLQEEQNLIVATIRKDELALNAQTRANMTQIQIEARNRENADTRYRGRVALLRVSAFMEMKQKAQKGYNGQGNGGYQYIDESGKVASFDYNAMQASDTEAKKYAKAWVKAKEQLQAEDWAGDEIGKEKALAKLEIERAKGAKKRKVGFDRLARLESTGKISSKKAKSQKAKLDAKLDQTMRATLKKFKNKAHMRGIVKSRLESEKKLGMKTPGRPTNEYKGAKGWDKYLTPKED